MIASITLQSKKKGEINKFLSRYYSIDLEIQNHLKWRKLYDNPIDMTDLIGAYVDNYGDYNLKMWISLDQDIYINVSNKNANEIIKYLFERYPY